MASRLRIEDNICAGQGGRDADHDDLHCVRERRKPAFFGGCLKVRLRGTWGDDVRGSGLWAGAENNFHYKEGCAMRASRPRRAVTGFGQGIPVLENNCSFFRFACGGQAAIA